MCQTHILCAYIIETSMHEIIWIISKENKCYNFATMGIIARKYQTEFVCRYDKAVGVPYYSAEDFKDLKQEKSVFINTSNIETHYFFYYYDNYKTDKLILFCPGIGPGHTAYLREIEYLAKKGYKVLTLDYAGTGESKG